MSKIIVDQIEGLSSQLVTFNDGISVSGSVSISGQTALTNAIASIQNDTNNNRIVITDALGTVSYLDLSSYLDDTNDFVTAAELNTVTGVLTLTRNSGSEVTVDIGYDTLQSNINAEETARIAADAALQTQIDATDSNLSNYQLLSEKGQANGYAGLDANGLVPSSQLPSFVDDVIEVANFASLPVTGETGKIYVTIDSGDVYRWSGSAYIQINDAVSSADQATKLATARSFTLSGDVTSSPVNFDGSGNVTLAATVPESSVTQHQSALQITQSQITDLTFPTPNDASITIAGGTSIAVDAPNIFTLNQSGNQTITINHADTSTLDGAYGSDQSPAYTITGLTVDSNGHLTGVTQDLAPSNAWDATITIAAGAGLSGGGDFTTNQASIETITLDVDATELANIIQGGTYISVSSVQLPPEYNTVLSIDYVGPTPPSPSQNTNVIGSYAVMCAPYGPGQQDPFLPTDSTVSGSNYLFCELANSYATQVTPDPAPSGTWKIRSYYAYVSQTFLAQRIA